MTISAIKKVAIIIGVFCVTIMTSSFADEEVSPYQTLMVNSQHSSVEFEISFMTVSKVKGRFANYGGHFNYDPERNIIAGLDVTIDMNGLNTFDKARDKHLLGPDFFDSRRYPSIRFVQTQEQKSAKEIIGELVIKGIGVPTKLNVEYLGVKEDSTKRKSYFFSAETRIKRSDFSLHWNKILQEGEYVLGDEIHIMISVEANLTSAIPPFSRFFALDKEEREILKDKVKEAPKPARAIKGNESVDYQEYISMRDQRDYFLKEREGLLTENKTLREQVSKNRMAEEVKDRDDWVMVRKMALVLMVFLLLTVSILYTVKLKRNPEIYVNANTDKKSFLWSSALDLMMMALLLCISVFLFIAEN